MADKDRQSTNAWNAVFCAITTSLVWCPALEMKGKYWKESVKMLGTVIHCLRGTPYVYQGEELGMTNTDFTDISQFKDVESLNHYQILQDKGMSPSDAPAYRAGAFQGQRAYAHAALDCAQNRGLGSTATM